MRVGECRNLAEDWVARREAGLPGYVGAYLGGSTAALAPDAPMPGGSDLDVYVALEGPLPEKRGKFEYQGALLEVSYVSWAAISPAERALKDYHLAHSLRYGQVAGDPRGRLRPLMEQVARHFGTGPIGLPGGIRRWKRCAQGLPVCARTRRCRTKPSRGFFPRGLPPTRC